MIQNADDNQYSEHEKPSLAFLYRDDGYLWLGCNEQGFSAANVKAIYRIAGSTKKVEGAAKGYIGEKGIGFKSVFKVADVVWVKSRGTPPDSLDAASRNANTSFRSFVFPL